MSTSTPTLTAADFSAQMVAQLRILDPNISAEVGTPERKILDTVAQSLADNQVDLTGLSSGTDISTLYGSNLDNFTALFGYARQGATYGSGYVVFSRNTEAPANITIPVGTTIQSDTATSEGQYLQYETTVTGTITQGSTSSAAVLVQCTVSGSQGDAATNTLTNLVNSGTGVVGGITSVTNPAPITNGTDAETDNAYKARFTNTVFRNLAGTEDQYLALAVSTTYTTKSNVIGPVSSYQEYIQIPDVDDAGYLNSVQYANGAMLADGSTLAIANTGGTMGQWTTSLSAIPYAQDIYLNPAPLVSTTIDATYFYRQGTDYNFNYPAIEAGDTEREVATAWAADTAYSAGQQVIYQGQTYAALVAFTSGSTFSASNWKLASTTASNVAPNFTFFNVYNPSSGLAASDNLITATPGAIMLSEFNYLSSASRNSIKHNVYNCMDIYVDGSNPTDASCVFLPGLTPFTANPNDVLYVENFRRDGEPIQRPNPGNFFTPLFQAPLTSLPDTITATVGSDVYNYYLGYHYWLVHEVSILGGSIRARDGIEWNASLNADDGTTGGTVPGAQPPIPYAQSLAPYTPGSDETAGNTTIASLSAAQIQVEVDDYYYDANITTLQATMESSRPTTVDVLTHSATMRYFKPDVTVIYTPTSSSSTTNAAIGTSLSSFFGNQIFGSVCLLSDILALVQQTPGVSNVRWSNDLPSVPNDIRVYETDINGYPLHTPWVDRITNGTSIRSEIQRLYIPAWGTFGPNDSFQLQWTDTINAVTWTSGVINLSTLSLSTLATALTSGTGYPASGIYHNISITQDSYSGVAASPMQSFQLAYTGADGAPFLPSVINLNVITSCYTYDQDFYLRDDELAASPTGTAPNDTVAGAIIRARAQGTFVRPGIG